MAKIILSHISALQALRQYRIDGNFNTIIAKLNATANKKCISSENTNKADEQIHILIKGKNQKRNSKRFKYHLSAKIPVNKSYISMDAK